MEFQVLACMLMSCCSGALSFRCQDQVQAVLESFDFPGPKQQAFASLEKGAGQSGWL